MVIDVNQAYSGGDNSVIYTNIKSYCTPETNVMCQLPLKLIKNTHTEQQEPFLIRLQVGKQVRHFFHIFLSNQHQSGKYEICVSSPSSLLFAPFGKTFIHLLKVNVTLWCLSPEIQDLQRDEILGGFPLVSCYFLPLPEFCWITKAVLAPG